MPNWSSNTLIITIDNETDKAKSQLAEFLETINSAKDSDKGIFSVFFPCPQELYDNPGNGFDTWYQWHVTNWGTKWDVPYKEVRFSEDNDDTTCQMWFDTAWAPPEKFVESVSKLFPELEFKVAYSEGGNAYAGYVVYINGEETLSCLLDNVEFDVTTFINDDMEEEEDYVPCDEWQAFLDEYGLHTGG